MATRLSPRNSEVNALEQRGYLIGKKIGQGSYATVHLADYVDGTSPKKMRLACKIFDKEKAPRDFLDKFFPRELEILTKIENPHIIQVHSILQRGPRVFIFMRYADNGDLLDFVKRNGVVPEQQSKLWFRQMASGLHYLHGKNIAHRDLKCENILLSRRFNVKLADFGFARFCADNDGRRVLSQTYCGSAAYAAPEVVSGTPYNPKLADVWSLGIILFIMLNASMPFDDANLRKLLKDQMSRNWVFRSRVRDTVSALAKSIVRHILEPDITLRLTLDRVLGHEWVRTRKEKPGSLGGRLVHSAPPIHPQVSGGGVNMGGSGLAATGSPPAVARTGITAFKNQENAVQNIGAKSMDATAKDSTGQPPIVVE
ncbi:testis-specific serine/threonine-protein kinase 2 [Diprion similis]|uniref:testis-specific serine/threonine-protein kinase 2 n=1 Tax=Diprion similis TaxID=362088 RepID=UPI001EF7ED7C|nr:testis-specific serine/threonine-protein kinase 2 [Diprion similis]